MNIFKTALVAASFVAVTATGASAQSREDLNSRIHGEPAVEQWYAVTPHAADTQHARGAYARTHANQVRPQLRFQQQYEANPLVDDFHGN